MFVFIMCEFNEFLGIVWIRRASGSCVELVDRTVRPKLCKKSKYVYDIGRVIY